MNIINQQQIKEMLELYATLATCTKKAKEFKQNYSKSFEFYKSSAEKGNIQGSHLIGSLYVKKIGVELNNIRALEYCQSSIEKGHLNSV